MNKVAKFFVAGGTLPPHTPSYVERPADEQLLAEAQAGTFCYVLTSRQMGKSSLMSRTAYRLKEEGVRTAVVDLTQIGIVTTEEWYLGLLIQLKRSLRLKQDPVAWWQAHKPLGDVQRFTNFLRDVILTEIESKRVVIFIDEIDITLNLEFTDDFFAAIRAMYNARANDPEFKRLTFVLLGVASPSDLIEDRRRTPFNIGLGIALEEFSQADVTVLEEGLEAVYRGQGAAILARIYDWTNGHPYLTQQLCLNVAKSRQRYWSHEQVDGLVEQLFFSQAIKQESNLQFVQARVLKSPQRRQLLHLYRQVYTGSKISHNVQSLVQNELKLAGLLKAENGLLTIRNHIYRRVFDLAWVRKNSETTDFFVAGGTLQPDAPSYVKRPADEQLLQLTQAGTFCYVLTPRQMGKSSLMTHTADKLKAQGVSTAIIDLTQIGTGTVNQWYQGLLTQLQEGLRLAEEPIRWWQARSSLTYVQRFTNFLRDVVLSDISGQVVIFIDEIDTTLALDFTDDFFAAIRAVYNARGDKPEFKRLTFVLLGVASPPELIKERSRTPFNIGQSITLAEFSRLEADVLQEGLEAICPAQGQAIFERIYHWTSGHPYLSQHLCLAIAKRAQARWGEQEIDQLVDNLFLTEATNKDSNLQFVQDKVLGSLQRRQLLLLYKQVYQGQEVPDEAQSIIHNQLKLSGLVKSENGSLQIRNRIYHRVFDLAWVKKHTQINWIRLVAGVAIVVALLASGSIAYNMWVDIDARDAITDFYEAGTPEERAASLAHLLRLQSFFSPTDYAYKAKELFFSLSRNEQLALFGNYHVAEADLIDLIQVLYTTLADVDGSDQTRPLLESMVEALTQVQASSQTTDLQNEINSWLQGRRYASQNQAEQALAQYNQALALNGENPATLYERARLLSQLSRHEQALRDLELVVAIANRTTSPATPTPTVTAIPTSTPSPLAPTPTSVSETSTNVVSTAIQSVTPTLEGTPSVPATRVPATPTAIPSVDGIKSVFGTPAEIIGQGRNFIQDDPQLMEALANAPTEQYPNLRRVVPPPTATPSPTATPIASASSPATTQVSTLTPTISPTPTSPTVTPTNSPTLPPSTTATLTPSPEETTIPSGTSVTANATPSITTETPTTIPTATAESPTLIPSQTPESPTLIPSQTTESPTLIPSQTTETATAIPTASAVTPTAIPTASPETATAIPTATPITATAIPSQTPVPPSITPSVPPVTATFTASPIPVTASQTPVIPTMTPSNTAIPTATPVTPTIIPSATFAPTVTPSATLVTPTPSATRAAYARPVLVAPQENASISNNTLLQWSWDGTLQENEWFDVRVWREGEAALGITWTKETSYDVDPTIKGGGNYLWTIVVIRGQDGQMLAELSQAAAARRLNINIGGPKATEGPQPTATR